MLGEGYSHRQLVVQITGSRKVLEWPPGAFQNGMCKYDIKTP